MINCKDLLTADIYKYTIVLQIDVIPINDKT